MYCKINCLRISSYSKSSTYSSAIDTDELTKSYFEKYYNRSGGAAGGTSSSGLASAYTALNRDADNRWAAHGAS